MGKNNRYTELIEAIFHEQYREGLEEFEFVREDIERFASSLGIELPKNLGDLIYSFRYRTPLPESIRRTCPAGKQWLIQPAGRSKYRFQLTGIMEIAPNPNLAQTKLPDATPGIIRNYALGDEQALLAKLRYNRLVDIFTRVTCYSLQNHLRTAIAGIGQVETDEIYVGLDRNGSHFVFPVQAKGGRDRLSVVQIQQDISMCSRKFVGLICRPIAAQFLAQDVIALFELADTEDGVRVVCEKHYKLVPPDQITDADLQNYSRLRIED
jgi:hypothetical protein